MKLVFPLKLPDVWKKPKGQQISIKNYLFEFEVFLKRRNIKSLTHAMRAIEHTLLGYLFG